MTAQVLRDAASKMRERAEAANTVAWYVPETLVKGKSLDPVDEVVDAEHIASWGPVVALAVADWLELMAEMVTAKLLLDHSAETQAALKVARAYLGVSV